MTDRATTEAPQTRKRVAKVTERLEQASIKLNDYSITIGERLRLIAFVLDKTKTRPPRPPPVIT